MKFTPASGYIAVQIETMKKSEYGIYIPDNALTDRLSKATVVGTSQERVETSTELLQPKYKLNETVLFPKGSGYPLKLDGIDLVILKNDEVFGTIEE